MKTLQIHLQINFKRDRDRDRDRDRNRKRETMPGIILWNIDYLSKPMS